MAVGRKSIFSEGGSDVTHTLSYNFCRLTWTKANFLSSNYFHNIICVRFVFLNTINFIIISMLTIHYYRVTNDSFRIIGQ